MQGSFLLQSSAEVTSNIYSATAANPNLVISLDTNLPLNFRAAAIETHSMIIVIMILPMTTLRLMML